jgi:hypothetical protein
LDDNQINIAGATKVGLRSYLVKNAIHAGNILEELGILG